MPLTDTAIRHTPARERSYKISDSGGLFLLVNPIGSRLWRFKYRYDGREKLLSFGPYPVTSLRRARVKRDEAKALLLDGRDPGEVKRTARRAAERQRTNTFGQIGDEYQDKLRKEGRAHRTLEKVRWLLDFTKQRIADRPITEIDAPEILSVLREIESTGRYETARRLRSTIGSIFRYAIATGRANADPTYALQGALIRPQVTSRAAILDRQELGRLLLAIDGFQGQPTTKIGLQLLALLAPRPGEMRHATWAEFDLDEQTWRIPAERTKMRRPHRVPLPKQAITCLTELARFTGTGNLLFPSVRTTKKPISENTLNVALRRLGFGKDQVTSHGFRASFSTLANESGLWNSDAIERALGHIESNDVRRAYLRGEHWEERVRMATWWANELGTFRGLVTA